MSSRTIDQRLADATDFVLEMSDGNYAARLEPSEAGDTVDAISVGLNLMAESLELERDRRTRAEALLADEVRAYDDAPVMFCSIELDNYEIVKCNETMAKALGIEREKLLRRRLLGFLPLEERGIAKRSLTAISRGEPPEQTTFHLRGADSERIPVLVSGSPLESEDDRLRLVLSDVTREQTLASRLRDAQKLEVVGRLASGVAHDFNNTLQVILGASALLADGFGPEHPATRELDAIIQAAGHGSGLTRQLLALSKPLPERTVPRRDINAIVRGCQPLLLRTLGPSNALVLELSEDEMPVRIDIGELTQILINLAINGRDAMPKDGVLTIRTRAVGDACFVVEVSDNGVGIPRGMIERVMDPFVTTKTESGGTGLGLSVCKRIAEGWGGRLGLRSEPGVGTSVEIEVPRDAGPIDDADAASHSRAGAASRRILVADDDPMVRNLIVRTLERAGHAVLSADSVGMGVRLFHEASDIDVLVTDIVMPDGSGVELAEAVWRARPTLPVVFMSGYTGNAIDKGVLERPHVRFVAKPFRPAQLEQLFEELEVGRSPSQ